MFPTLLKTRIHIFHSVSLNISKRMVVNAGNSLLTVMFKVLHASWVIAVDFFFKKFTQKKKKVRWHKVCGSWWLESVPDNATAKEVIPDS